MSIGQSVGLFNILTLNVILLIMSFSNEGQILSKKLKCTCPEYFCCPLDVEDSGDSPDWLAGDC